MTGPPGSKRKGRGGGCGLVLLLLLVIVVAGVIILGAPIREAKQTEQRVNDLHGDAPAFVPSPDGSIAPERIEAFLRIREQVWDHCRE